MKTIVGKKPDYQPKESRGLSLEEMVDDRIIDGEQLLAARVLSIWLQDLRRGHKMARKSLSTYPIFDFWASAAGFVPDDLRDGFLNAAR